MFPLEEKEKPLVEMGTSVDEKKVNGLFFNPIYRNEK